jgi:hypothetical protein
MFTYFSFTIYFWRLIGVIILFMYIILSKTYITLQNKYRYRYNYIDELCILFLLLETPIEQNQRLKSYVICMKCEKNDVNALFLPCTHHRFCMKCAENVSNCPVCGKFIRQRIRTYMVWTCNRLFIVLFNMDISVQI